MKNRIDNLVVTSARRALSRWPFGLALTVLLVGLGIAYAKRERTGAALNQPTAFVERGPLTISIIESGTIRPRQQIILKNEMDDPSTIIFLVKEGTRVKKGDLLVQLDATRMDTELVERKIRVQNGEAAMIYAQENFGVVTNQAQADIDQADLEFKFAQQDLEKYLRGEYPKQLKELDAKITLSEEELGRAEEDLRWSRILFKEKYLSQSELQQDELAAKKAKLNLELAREDLSLAKNYTHQRQLAQLRSNVKQTEMALERARRKAAANIAQARAELRAKEASLEEEKARLQRVESEIAKAFIRAPIEGMALYASSVSTEWDDDDGRIEEGATVDERGEIIYLPTADSFSVDIRVPEVDLNKLQIGLPAQIVVDALPGRTLTGTVTSIAPLPDSRSRFMNPNLKLYNTVIDMDAADAPLRNGMSCRVETLVKEFAETLYVPIQSVVQQNGQPLAFVVHGYQATPTPVTLGFDNNRVVQILAGLAAGQSVLLTPPLGTEARSSPGRDRQGSGAPNAHSTNTPASLDVALNADDKRSPTSTKDSK